MLHQAFVAQPAGGINYLELFREALIRAPGVRRFDAAVAYATSGGVRLLNEACLGVDRDTWMEVRKRWLVGIDYCRTEPLALEMLRDIPRSEVRIHAGSTVVARKRCTPLVPYHPKLYILRGPNTIGTICGSGNLSRNGLTRGHEVGHLMVAAHPANNIEKSVYRICQRLARWFAHSWNNASPIGSIFDRYLQIYESSQHLRAPTPTDDDASEIATMSTGSHHRALGPEDLRKLRACRRLWIEAGNLHHNRGKDEQGQWRPGNQLMLTPMTRVFFGFAASDLPRDSKLGEVAIIYAGHIRNDCSLRFSNNSMDVLTLPVPGAGGPDKYDQENLLFEKMSNGAFRLSLGTVQEKKIWIRKSKAIDGYHRMTSGRQWGVF